MARHVASMPRRACPPRRAALHADRSQPTRDRSAALASGPPVAHGIQRKPSALERQKMFPVDPTPQPVKTAARPVNKPIGADPWNARAAWFTDNRTAIFTIIICLVGLTIGWQMFAERMGDRTERAENATADVARIWGGP